MKKTLQTKSLLTLLLLFVFSLSAMAQTTPVAFDFTVVPTPAQCDGQGVFTFNVVPGLDAGTIEFKVYTGATATGPFRIVTGNPPYVLPTLGADTYTIVGTYTSAAGVITTVTHPGIITTTNARPVYNPTSQNAHCGNDGVVSIQVVSGAAFSFELRDRDTDAVIIAAQRNNVFTDLPVGRYKIVATDVCGQTQNLNATISQAATLINIDDYVYPYGRPPVHELPTCNTIKVQHTIFTTGEQEVFYPLQLEYIVTAPDGTVSSVFQTITLADALNSMPPFGPNNYQFLTAELPFYNDQDYRYDLIIKDNCNNIFRKLNNIIHETFQASAEPDFSHCKEVLKVNLLEWSGATTVHFLSPPGFDAIASQYNPSHPNFDGTAPIEYGEHFPDGNYVLEVTNCDNRTLTITANVDKPLPDLILSGTIGCEVGALGSVSGELTPAKTDFVSVTLLEAPVGYVPGDEGMNWSGGIAQDDASKFTWPPSGTTPNLIPGTYKLKVVNECGDVFEKPVTLVLGGEGILNLNVVNRPGCADDFGSVSIQDAPTPPNLMKSIYAARIMDGPDAWDAANTAPLDITATNVANGIVYINGLPEGDYVFELTDICGPKNWDINVVGYENTIDRVDYVTNDCSGYDLTPVREGSNNLGSFWFQKRLPDGRWAHPLYTDDPTNPNFGLYGVYDDTPVAPSITSPVPGALNPVTFTTDAIQLRAPDFNPVTGRWEPVTANFFLQGEFRVVEVLNIIGNGHARGERCFRELQRFTYGGNVIIEDVLFVPTSETQATATVRATGVSPFQYKISAPADAVTPFQSSPSFPGLTVGVVYEFTIINTCGTAIRSKQADAQSELQVTQIGDCDGDDVTLSVPSYSFYTYVWTKDSAPGTRLNPGGESSLVLDNFDSATDAGDYTLVITYTDDPTVFSQTIHWNIAPNTLPAAGNDSLNNTLCTNAAALPLDLNTYLSGQFDTAGGKWTDASGAEVINGSYNIAAVTTNTVLNFTYTVSNTCGNSDTAAIRITVSETPATPTVVPVGILCEGIPSFTLQATTTTTAPGLVYSWTGPNGYTSNLQNPIISNPVIANSGDYIVTVSNGSCASAPATVSVTVTAAPNAGGNNTTTICNPVAGSVETLSDYLVAPFDGGGTWALSATNTPPLGSFDPLLNKFNTAGLFGTYDFTYSVTACGTTAVAVISFVLNAIPNDPIATVDNALVCENGSIQLRTTDVADAYSWTKGGTVVSTAQNPVLPATLAAGGDYVLTISVNGCTAESAPVAVTVTPLPQFRLAGNTVICPTQFTTLSVTPTNFTAGDANITYEWMHEGTVVSTTSTARVDDLGDYTVRVTNVNGGCISPAQTITVTADPDPFTIVLGGDCIDEKFIMSITNIADIGTTQSIVWSGPGLSATTGNNPTIDLTAKDKGIYEVTVTNADGCFKTQSIDVTSTSCMIPRGISPEEVDGKNDFFDLTNLGVDNLQIFNRYGLQVYEKNNYTKEWYGQSDKGDLPTGTYFYVAKMADKQVTGWVYIQRNSN